MRHRSASYSSLFEKVVKFLHGVAHDGSGQSNEHCHKCEGSPRQEIHPRHAPSSSATRISTATNQSSRSISTRNRPAPCPLPHPDTDRSDGDGHGVSLSR